MNFYKLLRKRQPMENWVKYLNITLQKIPDWTKKSWKISNIIQENITWNSVSYTTQMNVIAMLETEASQNIQIDLLALRVRNWPAMQETQLQSLGWEAPLEKGMATHSSILENPMDRGACNWQAIVLGVAMNWTQVSDFHIHTYIHTWNIYIGWSICIKFKTVKNWKM